MRSLFSKILLWLVATAMITGVGAVVVTFLATPKVLRDGPWPGRAVRFYAEEAWRSYESGGKAELAEYLERLRETAVMEGHLTDANGRDLVDGRDLSAVVEKLHRSRYLLASHQGRLITGRLTGNGRVVFLLYLPRRLSSFPLVLPHQFWVAGSAVLLCYLLARYLTNPLRRLQEAADRLGKGDLRTRVSVERKDELGRLAASFNQMAERIENLVQSQQRLLTDVSHEIRSPLTRLSVAVELARSSGAPKRELDIIQQQADRLNTLVSSLLQVTRAEMNPVSLKREPVNLLALARELADACGVEARASGCSIRVEGPENCAVNADAELLRRAVENVLRNAVRHAPRDTAVEVRIQPGGRITIRDSGPGVPEQSLPFLFDAFYRVEGQAAAGAGLGLSIAKRAVELHRGAISARNASPGLEVTLELPESRP
ncbi:MAG: HAMP domain-containing protein [Acidobacteria bacterium]|nr:HAMP domain-containing protein [Acidobacteriota bacterium]